LMGMERKLLGMLLVESNQSSIRLGDRPPGNLRLLHILLDLRTSLDV
jgi:hypothetical protein